MSIRIFIILILLLALPLPLMAGNDTAPIKQQGIETSTNNGIGESSDNNNVQGETTIEEAFNNDDPPLLIKDTDSGSDILRKAGNLLDYGDYPALVELLESGLELDRFDVDELLEAHRMLGIGYFILQDKPKAREHFLRLLTHEPDTTLDSLYVPPIIIEFFEHVREENKPMLDAIRSRRSGKTELVIKRYNPYIINFIPFGVGQFQNDQYIKGSLFLSAEVLTFGFNIAAYFASNGLKSGDGYYSEGNAERAVQWRVVQYTALGLFVGVLTWGIIDACLNHQDFTTIENPNGDKDTETPNESLKPKLTASGFEF